MEQLKLLMDYTKFHIGVYLSFGTAGISLIKLELVDAFQMLPGVVLMFCAGCAGGIIASNIPEHKCWSRYRKAKFKIFWFETSDYYYWSKVEHLCFWAGIIVTAVLVLAIDV